MTLRLWLRSARMGPALAFALASATLAGCAAHMGRLAYTPQTVAPTTVDSTSLTSTLTGPSVVAVGPMFGDTLIGLVPGTADSSRRYLGRLRNGYTADTLNVFLLGDNRPGHRSTRLGPEYNTMRQMFTLNPVKFFKGLITIPIALVKGLYPDLALIRDIPGRLRQAPTFGAEQYVNSAMLAKADSLNVRGEIVSAVINTGDLVTDGRYPAHWERFLRITRPLTSRVPYFAVAGNHERTDDPDGVANWRTATGLPVGGDRLYYCFDSADGWVRFIALDSNPIVDPANRWSREVTEKYSNEQIEWMVARVREHEGPVFVFLHHPPFSVGFHHGEWQADSVLSLRRERMLTALHEVGIGVLASGHEHAYQRAVFTWPDAVLINVVTGGGGGPLHILPSPAESARMFSEYKVAGSTVAPENVVTGSYNHFIHLRLWFGGGELFTYAVDHQSRATLADKVRIDLSRYGIPTIDEHKMPIPRKGPGVTAPHEATRATAAPATADTTETSRKLLTRPSPREVGGQQVTRTTAIRDSIAAARRDSSATVKSDSLKSRRRRIAPAVPSKPTTR